MPRNSLRHFLGVIVVLLACVFAATGFCLLVFALSSSTCICGCAKALTAKIRQGVITCAKSDLHSQKLGELTHV
jgi:hypothetical protein